MDPAPGQLETLTPETCLKLLGSKRVGRLAVVVDGRPTIVPVNYVLDGDTVIFRTGEATVITEASLRWVAFEVDEIDEAQHRGWSVSVQGFGREIGDALDAESRRLAALPLETWAGGDRHRIFKVVADTITGRGIIPAHG